MAIGHVEYDRFKISNRFMLHNQRRAHRFCACLTFCTSVYLWAISSWRSDEAFIATARNVRNADKFLHFYCVVVISYTVALTLQVKFYHFLFPFWLNYRLIFGESDPNRFQDNLLYETNKTETWNGKKSRISTESKICILWSRWGMNGATERLIERNLMVFISQFTFSHLLMTGKGIPNWGLTKKQIGNMLWMSGFLNSLISSTFFSV